MKLKLSNKVIGEVTNANNSISNTLGELNIRLILTIFFILAVTFCIYWFTIRESSIWDYCMNKYKSGNYESPAACIKSHGLKWDK